MQLQLPLHLNALGGAVDIASSGAMTTVKGTLNVDKAVTLDTTLNVQSDTGQMEILKLQMINSQ